MNRTINNLIMITIGAAIGSVVTWKLVKTKYEEIADKEIESMKQYFETKEAGENIVKDSEEHVESVGDKEEKTYKEYVGRYTSQQLTKPETKLEEEDEEVRMVKPYIITPEEFADSEYATETLTYYADGFIEDDFGIVWDSEEVEEILGEDFADHFGEYEDDSVYVRNENKEIDYEILRDERKKWENDE